MKAKKLTKRQGWFEEAYFWTAAKTQIIAPGFVAPEVVYSTERDPPVENIYLDHDYDDRCLIRAQYYLERAGIPAGDK